MATTSGLNTSTSTTPSIQPQTQAQSLANPGLNANQISLATPPASFSQGRRFFITENNGQYQLTAIRSPGSQSSTAPNANPQLPADALEVNASIAYAISTGTLDPASYMAQHVAQLARLNDVVKQVGSTPLQTPSLLGEITGAQFDAAAILQFLKKSKSELDDSNVKADISSLGQDFLSKSLAASLKSDIARYDSDDAQIKTLQSQLDNLNKQSNPDQSQISSLNSQIATLKADSAAAFADAQQISQLLFKGGNTGINALRKDIEKLNKAQLTKLSNVVTKSVTKSIANQIDNALLGDNPIQSPTNAPTLKTADGTVIKTPEEQTKEAVIDQLSSDEFEASLEQSIIDNAQDFGLGDLSPEELKSVAKAVATATIQSIIDSPEMIDEAINDSNALLNDVSQIIELEVVGQSAKEKLPNNV